MLHMYIMWHTYIYTCIHIYIYTCIYTHIRTHAYIHTYIQASNENKPVTPGATAMAKAVDDLDDDDFEKELGL